MGREIKRVAAGFAWPLGEVWEGFNNPHPSAKKCRACGGSGLSTVAHYLKDLWYGYRPFQPESRGSKPFLPTDEHVWARAKWNVDRSPGLSETGEFAIHQEAMRLAAHFNARWSHHLNDEDVAALIAGERLFELTHDFIPGKGWEPRATRPTAREVNVWSCCDFGHDSTNQWIVVGAECKRLGVPYGCTRCHGRSAIWSSRGARKRYESWEPIEPPSGEWWQVWETVSKGSPVTPAFATREELIDYLVEGGDARDRARGAGGWSRENAESFVAAAWAPTLIGSAGTIYEPRDGVPDESLPEEAVR